MRTLLVGLLLSFASTAFAVPSLRLSWDDCSVITPNKNWSGPGSYRLVVSGTGFTGTSRSLNASIGFSTGRAVPAWDFSTFDFWGVGPCQSPSRMTVGAGSGACPNYPASVVSGMMVEGSLTQPANTGIQLNTTLDPSFVADPDQRYTFFRIDFDHTQSLAGSQPPPACGSVDAPFCMMLTSSYWVRGDGVATNGLASDLGYARWQDPANASNCDVPVPAAAKTWGAIKAQYR